MTDTTLTPVLTEAGAALIKADVAAFKRDRRRYSDYVAEMEVLAEDVAYHVGLFRDAYRETYPKAAGDEVKAYATKVRNGLNYWVGKRETTDDNAPINLLTAGGVEALASMINDDADKILAAIYSEVERRNK